jgi:hypothetical protein
MDIYEIRKKTAYEETILPTPKSETQNWLRGMSSDFQFAVTLTMKQSILVNTERGQFVHKLQRKDCDAIALRFTQKLNRQVFGKAAERYSKGLRYLTVVEGERSCKNLHLHMAVGDFPKNILYNHFAVHVKNAVDLVSELDEQHNVQIFDGGWTDYITKELGRKDTDNVLWQLF